MSITQEEERLSKAKQALPSLFKQIDVVVAQSKDELNAATSLNALEQQIQRAGIALWSLGKNLAIKHIDDRGLYWARLELTSYIRQTTFTFSISFEARNTCIEMLEASSRGRQSLDFCHTTSAKNILILGFDPFHLDQKIHQSNPSGLAALSLDSAIIASADETAKVSSVLVPVRYADFDAGEIESLLQPIYANTLVDLVLTISMGRDHFDLERFPGRRRSSENPDNQHVFSGGTASSPKIPMLNNKPLAGPEFLEFSLPVPALQQASLRGGKTYEVRDRRIVQTLKGRMEPNTLSALESHTAVEGSGGGYLSNEISYRCLRIARRLNSKIPSGHIHTPRIDGYEKDKLTLIVKQLREMIKNCLPYI